MSDPLTLAIPALLALVVGEAWLTQREARRRYDRRDAVASLVTFGGNALVLTLLKAPIYAFYLVLYEHRLASFESGVAAWLGCVVVFDLLFYCYHRASHRVRFLWTSHVTHHSSQEYNLTTGVRQSFTAAFTRMLFYWPLPLLGFHPLLIVSAGSFCALYGFWPHTRHIGRLGWLEYVLVTPSHHRVHHGTNTEYLDRNYGNVFIVWDKVFGTFAREQAPPVYGLTKNIDTYNPARIIFHDWVQLARDLRGARTARDAVGYLLGPPGWTPQHEPSALAARETTVIQE